MFVIRTKNDILQSEKNTSPWSNDNSKSRFFFKLGFYASSYSGLCPNILIILLIRQNIKFILINIYFIILFYKKNLE